MDNYSIGIAAGVIILIIFVLVQIFKKPKVIKSDNNNAAVNPDLSDTAQ